MRLAIGLTAWTLAAALGGGHALAEGNWPQFRGPQSLGVGGDAGLPQQWSATENVAWTAAIDGRGWSSPVVWQNRVFLTTVTSDGPAEEQKKGLYFGGERPEISQATHHWVVICLELASGRELWRREVHQGRPLSSIHLKNTYASETPATDGQRLYVYFGNLGVYCLDFDGQIVWKHEWGALPTANGWGTGASPIVYQDRVYIVNDNERRSFVVALDKHSGRELWRIDRPDHSNWATPFIWKNPLRTELVASGTRNVAAYDLQGRLLWQLEGMSHNAIPTPFAGHGLLYVASGHTLARDKPLVAIRPGATGTLRLDDDASGDYVAWRQMKAAPYNPSPLLYEDYLYVLLDGGYLACFDARSGKLQYSKRRLPDGKAFTASPWAYGGRVFCLSEYGVTFVVEAGPRFKLLGTNPLADDDMCLATPALAGDRLLVRSDRQLYCLANQAKGP